jgi:hypothetical protein
MSTLGKKDKLKKYKNIKKLAINLVTLISIDNKSIGSILFSKNYPPLPLLKKKHKATLKKMHISYQPPLPV